MHRRKREGVALEIGRASRSGGRYMGRYNRGAGTVFPMVEPRWAAWHASRLCKSSDGCFVETARLGQHP